MTVAESVQTNEELLKEYYTNDQILNMTLPEGSLFGLIPKMETFSGKTLPIPVRIASPQGGSASLSTAIANKTTSKEVNFELTRFKDYAVASIDREAKMASEVDGETGAWLDLAKVVIEGILNTSTRSIAISLFRDGTGIRGQISSSSNTGTATITLADPHDVQNFELQMYVQTVSARTGGTPRTGHAQIIGIDRDAGTLTVGVSNTETPANWSTLITSCAANDYICRDGDYGEVSPGLQSWLVPPSLRPTAPGQDDFFQQDRYSDMTRTMGVYHDGTNQPIEEAMIDLEGKCAVQNARITHMFMNNVQYRQLLKALQGKVVYTNITETAQSAEGPVAEVSFAGIEFQGVGGRVKVFADFNCPSMKLFALTLSTWMLYSLGPAPHIFDEGSDQKWLRSANDDTYEIRCGAYYVLGCRGAGFNGQADLATAA